jgi:NitT/TauT family transport system ATP-binding protein
MMNAAIELRGVEKVFDGAESVFALNDLDFRVNESEFAVVLGPSGCGKSTLLNIVAGFERASGGEVLSYGRGVLGPGPVRAVVFQEAALFPWLNVWENVIFSPKINRQPLHEYYDRARQILYLVGLSKFSDSRPDQLSGGMKQRVGLARALMMAPKMFLMDEPFGALDAQTRLDMQQLLLDVWERDRRTLLFITHDIDEAILLADFVYVMTARPGRIRSRIPIELPRPRDVDVLISAEFNELRARIMSEIREESRHSYEQLSPGR